MYPSRPRTDGDVISSAPRVAPSLYPGLSHYAPLGRTIQLRIGVDCTLQAIQVVAKNRGQSASFCHSFTKLSLTNVYATYAEPKQPKFGSVDDQATIIGAMVMNQFRDSFAGYRQ